MSQVDWWGEPEAEYGDPIACSEMLRLDWSGTDSWLDILYVLSEDGNTEEAIDLVLDTFDDMLIARDFTRCSNALALMNAVSIRRISSSVLVSILGITIKAKDSLPDRVKFFDLVLTEVKSRKGRRYAKSLLEKYR